MKYLKWIDENCHSLKGKTVVVTGATGGIGFSLLEQLDYLDARVIMAIRNKDKAKKLLEKCSFKKEPEIIILDLESYDNIDKFILELSKRNIQVDYLINNAGVYNLKSRQSKHDHEIHLQVNTFSTIYLTEQMRKMYPDSKIIFVNSVSSMISKINEEDIEVYKHSSAIKRYGATKLLCMHYCLYLKNDLNILIHPGIVYTNMLTGGWPKIFRVICNPICKLLFMNSYKGALSILYAMTNDVAYTQIVSPQGLFSCWGYPKIRNLSNKIIKYDSKCIYQKIKAHLN